MPPESPDSPRARRRVGAVLRDKYTLERVLGVGGMATVYLAAHRNGNRVAVKILHDELSLHVDARARFVRESYVANSIGHPGAVRVLDDDIGDDGAAFLVMELLEGETLEERSRRRGGKLPLREVLALARELLDVLAAAHAKGVVHRDVKPENLFLTREGALKVLDFGIARVAGGSGTAATAAGLGMGTPAFMPPEQALGRAAEIDARTDLWAVGATLFKLCSGRLVHEAPTTQETFVRAATEPARSLAAVLPDAPPLVVELVDRALAFERTARWPDARAMQEGVEQAHTALFGEPVSLAAVVSAPGGEVHAEPLPEAPAPSARASGRTRSADPAWTRTDAHGDSGRRVSPTAPTVPGGDAITQALQTEPLPSRPPGGPGGPGGPAGQAGPTPEPLAAAAPEPRRRRAPWLAAALVLAATAGAAALQLSSARPRASSSPAPDGGPDAGAPCATNADCAGAVCGRAGRCVARRGCAESRACVAASGGRPSICRRDDGACVALETDDCRVLAEPGDVENDATIWIGAMFPTRGSEADTYGRPATNAADLARRDFAAVSGGLPPARAGGPRRPVAVVACDDASDPARVAAHLVDDVGVPAVVGFARSKEIVDLASSIFNPKGVLALASNTSSMLRSIPRPAGQGRLVYRVTTSADMVAPPTIAFLSEVLEPALRRAPGGLGPDGALQVALLRADNASGLSYADLYVAGLRFNGKSVAQNGDRFHAVVVPDSMTGDGADERAAAEIVAFQPNVVLDAGGAHAGLLRAIERLWPAGARLRPRYLVSAISEYLGAAAERPDLRARLFGLDNASTTPAMTKFTIRYNEVYTPRITPRDAQPAAYDAFYLFAFAAAALGEEPIAGPALARAIGRLVPPGRRIDVGPAGIYEVFSELAAGRSVDLVGAMTSLDFDLETGDATVDFSIYCFAEGRRGAGVEIVDAGLSFDARARAFSGSLRCR